MDRSKSFLVYEPVEYSRKTLQYYIEKSGSKVQFAVDLEDFSYLLQEESFDVIILDIQNEKQIRKTESFDLSGHYLIVTSADARLSKEVILGFYSVNDFLLKPIRKKQYLHSINKALLSFE